MSSSSSSSSILITQRLEGKVALITGAASGIGKSAATLFAKHGAKVIIADIQDDLGRSVGKDLDPTENDICYVHCDITSDTDVRNAVDLAISKFGKLDIMYNNAAIPGVTSTSELEIIRCDNDAFKRMLEVNVFGPYLGAKHAARVMIPEKKGCILFTSSICSVTFGDVPHAYSASKSAVVGMAKNLCVELGKYGIRVNCISPFGVATPMLKSCLGIAEESKAEEVVCAAANLKGVVLKTEDVAEAAMYLASDEAKYVSGMNLVVDGGYSLTNTSLSSVLKSLVS